MHKITSFFTRLKPSAELKSFRKRFEKFSIKEIACDFQSESGGGLGIVFIGLAAILLVFTIFINIADYSLFTYKRNAISKAMDYAVTAAVQQIDINKSIAGVANGFSETTGKNKLEGVELDIDAANRSFLTIFDENFDADNFSIDNNLLICATSTENGKLKYAIKANTQQVLEGELNNSSLMEWKLNQAIDQYWPESEDDSQVYINGNPKTNIIVNGTYLFALIRDIKITGLYSQRQINLSSFAGAKLER